jgi:hypothetical protein
MRKLIALSLVILSVSACSHLQNANTQVIRTGPQPDYYTDPDTIEIFASRDEVRKPYRETALVIFDSGGNQFSESASIGYLRHRAGELGADGIILLGSETTSMGGTYNGWSNSYNQINRKVMRARAIVYEESPRTPANR